MGYHRDLSYHTAIPGFGFECRLRAAGFCVVGMDASANVEEIPRETEPTIAELAAAVNGLVGTMNGLVTMVQQLAAGTQYAQQTAEAAGEVLKSLAIQKCAWHSRLAK